MQIINSFHHQSICHLISLPNHLLYLQRTYSTNLSSLLPLLVLQFFSITVVVAGQNTVASSTDHHHQTTTETTMHSSIVANSRANNPHLSPTSNIPSSSGTNNNLNSNNNFNHYPTTLSTDDLTSSTTANHRLRHHHIPSRGSAIPATDTLLNSIPIFPLDYDNLQPPKENGPTTVSFHVWVLSLDSIDEDSMTYVADIFMSQSWKDHRLKIPDTLVNTTSNYRLLPLSWLNYMWRPDSFFKNAKQVTFQEMTVPNHYLWMYEDKKILYMVKLTLLLSCSMKFQTYPHDTQQCKLQIESLSYTMDDLVFDWEKETPLVVDSHIELPQHNLVDSKIGECHNVYSSGNFTCVQVVFRFKRRLGYYLFHTYIPTCLIVIMSWISFWIKPEAVPARVTLCVTSLLTLSTQHAQSQKSLPPVSYIKAIDIFMSSCTVFVFSSLMEYLIINIVYLNHDNYTAQSGSTNYSDSANYNGNYYTGLGSNAFYLNRDTRLDCNLNKKKLKKQIKKNLKQKQKSNWFPNSSNDLDQNRTETNNNDFSDTTYPITKLNHYQQTPISTDMIANHNQNMPTNSSSLTNLSPNHIIIKDSIPNVINNSGCSIAVIAQSTTNCEHCLMDDKIRKQNKDSLCRKHVQCFQLNSPINNIGLKSVVTSIDEGRGTTTTTDTKNVTASLTTISNLNLDTSSNQMTSIQLNKDSDQTVPKKIRPLKNCSKHKRNQDAQQQSSQFEYLNNEFRPFMGDHYTQSILNKRDRAILVDKISRWTFPLSFIILNFIYWTVYLND